MTLFARLNADGSLSDVKIINQLDIKKCPHVIFVGEHYRADGSCRCDDPEHTDMNDWGYKWDGKSWV